MSKSTRVIISALAVLTVSILGALGFLYFRPLPVKPLLVAQASRADLNYIPQAIGFPVDGHPMITHVAIADLEQSGLTGVLVCDATANRIGWIRQSPRGVFTETFIGDSVQGPAHISLCDVYHHGRPDLLVASMGTIMPNNDKIGKIIIMENLGGGNFRTHVVAENIPRVTDVRGVDLTGTGRIDLVVGQFGYIEGQVQWMENLGDWKFRSHPLLDKPGTIMTPVADFYGDGKMGFAALVSQDSASVYGQVHLYHQNGKGNFEDQILWKTDNLSYGSSGINIGYLNGNGLPDLIFSNGDGMNTAFGAPAPWHGLQWLENRGHGEFVHHRIGDSSGCYSPICVDLNGDGKMDIVTVSAFNNANDPSAIWMTAWINDGHRNFTPVALNRDWPNLITVASGDLDGNGQPVLVTGGFNVFPPYVNMSRVTLWRKRQ